MEKLFEKQSANLNNPNWEQMNHREEQIYRRKSDLRTDFDRDYTRIIHSNAYRRLKGKTQVFFSPQNDHICTRSEHVNHVESVSYTIANTLGLNLELTKAISVAHDLGHAPFGHAGEKILSQILERDVGEKFWHEQNGLNFVDNIELLEDMNGNQRNLNLTYAVRDGIISHCGETNQNSLFPRECAIDLAKEYIKTNQYMPYTWEGCVVKISDKISYIGRDIQDAITLRILDSKKLKELSEILEKSKKEEINNTVIINELISDLCKNSTPETGLNFSKEGNEMMNLIKDFNYKNIYLAERLQIPQKYFSLMINQIYDLLKEQYDGEKTKENLENMKKIYPNLANSFLEWIKNYWNLEENRDTRIKNKVVYEMKDEKQYSKAIVHYISGMTDHYIMDLYSKTISF